MKLIRRKYEKISTFIFGTSTCINCLCKNNAKPNEEMNDSTKEENEIAMKIDQIIKENTIVEKNPNDDIDYSKKDLKTIYLAG